MVEGVPYIRNGYGSRSKWYRRVQRTGRAAFVDGPHRYFVRIDNLKDEAINLKVDEAYRTKYAGQAGRCAKPSHRRSARPPCGSLCSDQRTLKPAIQIDAQQEVRSSVKPALQQQVAK